MDDPGRGIGEGNGGPGGRAVMGVLALAIPHTRQQEPKQEIA
jgi:hypothetical protein